MARINLLPWRAERRKQRQKEFMAMLGAVGAGRACVLSFLIVMYYNGQIDGQNERNEYLHDQITAGRQADRRDRASSTRRRPSCSRARR